MTENIDPSADKAEQARPGEAEAVSVALDVWHAACHAEVSSIDAMTAVVAAAYPIIAEALADAVESQRDADHATRSKQTGHNTPCGGDSLNDCHVAAAYAAYSLAAYHVRRLSFGGSGGV